MKVKMEEYWNPMVPELSVTDFAKSLEFYRKTLGFKLRDRRSNPEFSYLEIEKVQIMIEQIHKTAWITDPLEYPLGRGVNFQIELSEIAPVFNRLKEAGIKLYRNLEENWYNAGNNLTGQLEFIVQDPDGYLLRFTQYLGEKTVS